MNKTYTAFFQETTGEGTIWIDTVQAATLEDAKVEARAKCLTDWGDSFAPEDIHCLGIAAGEVNILHWEDICDL